MDAKLWVLQILVLLIGCCHGKGEQNLMQLKATLSVIKLKLKILRESPQGLPALVLHLPFKASPSSYLIIVRIHKKSV